MQRAFGPLTLQPMHAKRSRKASRDRRGRRCGLTPGHQDTRILGEFA